MKKHSQTLPGPWNVWRSDRQMKCSRKDCNNEGVAQPVITFTAIGYPFAPRASAVLGDLICCREHASKNVSDFITDEGWQKIVQAFAEAGKAEPDRASARIEYIKEN